MLTLGQSTRVDKAGVNKLLEALKRLNLQRLFPKLFRRTERFEVAPTAAGVIHADNTPNEVRGLYAQAVKIEPRAPQLDVRPRDN